MLHLRVVDLGQNVAWRWVDLPWEEQGLVGCACLNREADREIGYHYLFGAFSVLQTEIGLTVFLRIHVEKGCQFLLGE